MTIVIEILSKKSRNHSPEIKSKVDPATIMGGKDSLFAFGCNNTMEW